MATKRRRPPLAPNQTADDRRQRFVSEYLQDHNATQAAIRAGYSPRSARQQGAYLMSDPNIRRVIDEAITEREERRRAAEARVLARYEISHDRIKGELARLAFSNVLDFGRVTSDGQFAFDMSATTRDEAAALHSLKVKRTRRTTGKGDNATVVEDVETQFRLADKRAALVDLGKATGLFADGPDLSVPVTFIVERTGISAKRGERA